MGKRVIHDTEMTIDEETGIITVKFPGWREDPSKMFSFFPGQGSGQGFPLPGNKITISDGSIISVSTGPNPEIAVEDDSFTIFLDAQIPDSPAAIILNASANGAGAGEVNLITNGYTGLTVRNSDVPRYGVFDKASSPGAQPAQVDGPVGGAVIDAEARSAIEEIIAAMKSLGHMEDLV
jgi:hypothetical protein